MPAAKKKATRRRKKWKSPLPKKELDILHGCWKETSTRKECLKLVEERLPNVSPPLAWGVVRKMSKVDRQWILTARQKERVKEAKKEERERKRRERAKARVVREARKEWRDKREELRSSLKERHMARLEREVEPEFFFCPDVRQQVNSLSCIFRVFSGEDVYGFSHCGSCLRCKRMDKYIPAVEKAIGGKRK